MCGYCSKTKLVGACPICKARPEVQAAEAVANVVSLAPVRERKNSEAKAVKAATESVCVEIRKQWNSGDKNVAVGLMVGLAGQLSDKYETWMKDAHELSEMDKRCAERGYIREDEELRRAQIMDEAIKWLGFNPLAATLLRCNECNAQVPWQDLLGHSCTPFVPDAEPMKALDAGLGEPLQSGDWAGLWKRVKAGMISEEEAVQFGQLWSK